jgi:RNA-dependent RNA polymerase
MNQQPSYRPRVLPAPTGQPALRSWNQQNYQQWPLVKVRLSNIPSRFGTVQSLHPILSKYGTVTRIEVARPGCAFVIFQPAPKVPFWEFGIDEFGSKKVHIELLKADRAKTIQSPVRLGVFYPEIISVIADEIGFGMQQTEHSVINQALVLGRKTGWTRSDIRLPAPAPYIRDVTIVLNLPREFLDVFFPLDINGITMQHRLTVRLTHVPKKIFRISRPQSGCTIILPLDCPPKFCRKVTTALFDNDQHWSDMKQWERITDAANAFDNDPNAPVRFRKERCIIDLGRWTCYAITISQQVIESPHFRKFCEALQDWNIEMVTIANDKFKIEKKQQCDIWKYLDPSKSFNNLDVMVHTLSYPVRYQLEVCLSRGIINEYNITEEFLKKLGGMREVDAQDMLERAAEHKKLFQNVMDILDLASTRPQKSLPRHCFRARSCHVTPTTIVFQSPTVEVSNRVIREYHDYGDRFLRVRFGDEVNIGQLYASSEIRQEQLYNRVKHVFEKGIIIGDCKFEFLAFGNSQFREHSAYFFASVPELTVADIRSRLGDFTEIRNPAKYGARLGQNFSTTRAIRQRVEVKDKLDDINHNGYCFTDGVGKISPVLCTLIASELKIFPVPSLLQFRLGGCKGVLAQWSDVRGLELHIRPSQYKFAAIHNGLEVIRTSQFVGASLNRQIIVILAALGVPFEVFITMETNLLMELAKAMIDEKTAMDVLQKNVDFNHSSITISEMIRSGFMASREPFVMALLQLWKTWMMKYLKEKAKLPVAKGAHLLGTADELGVLRGWYKTDKPNDLPEIFLKIDPDQSGVYTVVEGVCILARNPSLHPGDIRVVRAVNQPKLRHLRNVIVLPTTGDRDLGSMCSGGDLDGDDYLVIWDPDLIPKEWNHPAMEFPAIKPAPLDRDVEIEDMTDFFVQYMKNDQLPAIARAHLCFADQLIDGVKSDKCKFLPLKLF